MLHRLIWVVKCFCVMLFPYLCVSILTFKKYNNEEVSYTLYYSEVREKIKEVEKEYEESVRENNKVVNNLYQN